MMKISLYLMIMAFCLLLISLVGMQTSAHHFFKEMHELVGSIFILLIFLHLYLNRMMLKNIFKHKDDSK